MSCLYPEDDFPEDKTELELQGMDPGRYALVKQIQIKVVVKQVHTGGQREVADVVLVIKR